MYIFIEQINNVYHLELSGYLSLSNVSRTTDFERRTRRNKYSCVNGVHNRDSYEGPVEELELNERVRRPIAEREAERLRRAQRAAAHFAQAELRRREKEDNRRREIDQLAAVQVAVQLREMERLRLVDQLALRNREQELQNEADIVAAHMAEAERQRVQQQEDYERQRNALQGTMRQQEMRIQQIERDRIDAERRAFDMERAARELEKRNHGLQSEALAAAAAPLAEAERLRMQQQQDFEQQRNEMQEIMRAHEVRINQMETDQVKNQANQLEAIAAAAAPLAEAERLRIQQQQDFERQRNELHGKMRDQEVRIDQIDRDRIEAEQRALDMERAAREMEEQNNVLQTEAIAAATATLEEAERLRIQQQEVLEKQRVELRKLMRAHSKRIDKMRTYRLSHDFHFVFPMPGNYYPCQNIFTNCICITVKGDMLHSMYDLLVHTK